jgi:putative endonuclease
MSEHNELGKKGEEIAREYLQKKRYKIIANNWRFGKDEIDIIATKNNFLIIVEVKTRRTNYFGEPETAVTQKKQKFLIRATQAYIKQNNVNTETRFDIIAITVVSGKYRINHIKDAFYPTIQTS